MSYRDKRERKDNHYSSYSPHHKQSKDPKKDYSQYEINREKVCPFLVRVFYKDSQYNSLDSFSNSKFPSEELHIYTWFDATLRELTTLIEGAIDLSTAYKLKFSCLYYNFKGLLQRKELGDVYLNKANSSEIKTLYDLRFSIGDYLDICIEK